jgi:hypothetical protein
MSKSGKFLILLSLLLLKDFFILFAQDKSKTKLKMEFGTGFIQYNRSWIYYDNLSLENGNNYAFNFSLSPFIRFSKNKHSIRIKYEYFKKNSIYIFSHHDFYEKTDGDFKENRILSGFEQLIIDKTMKLYCFTDFGISTINYTGLYTWSYKGSLNTESFNINQFSLSCQPGLGIKIDLSDKIGLNLETSIWIGNGYDKNDVHELLPKLRIIPRPIALFGFSYTFIGNN